MCAQSALTRLTCGYSEATVIVMKTTTNWEVVLRGGRSVVVSASSAAAAEDIVRGWGRPALYPIWYTVVAS